MPTIKKSKDKIIVENLDLTATNRLFLETGQSLPVDIKILDKRAITDVQRKLIFALCSNIADYTGEDREIRRAIYMEANRRQNEIEKESLTQYTQTEASKLIDIIIDDTFTKGLTIGNLAQEYDHKINQRQTYAMALQRVCCICGRRGADIHHYDQIGTRGNREKISHIGLRALPLCRMHHTEIHNTNKEKFVKKHHIEPFEIDKKMEFFIKRGVIKDFKK